jgi:hypothetical protein
MRADDYQEPKQNDSELELDLAAAELVRRRESLALSMSALELEIDRTFDWREWVRRKPGMALALAFGLGVLVGRRS